MQTNLAMTPDAASVDEPLEIIKYVSFELAGEIYALNAARVYEVLRYTEITHVPGAPSFILGIINLRGNVVTVIDARSVFGLSSASHNQQSRIIVVEIEDFVLGILVDRVAEVIDLNQTAIETAPATGQDDSSRFIQGVYNEAEQMIILVDFSRVMDLVPR
jgi:purine-binding chemotaxis protein CheW